MTWTDYRYKRITKRSALRELDKFEFSAEDKAYLRSFLWHRGSAVNEEIRIMERALRSIALPGFDPKHPLCCNWCDGCRTTKLEPVERIRHEPGCLCGIAQRALERLRKHRATRPKRRSPR
jgi:hypothetical protein